jgi:hypothetical protein
MRRLVSGIASAFQVMILKALHINGIKNIELYMGGWYFSLLNFIAGAVCLSKGYWDAVPFFIFAITAMLCLVYIGKTLGNNLPPQKELVNINIALDVQSALLFAGLIRQGLKYKDPGAIILTTQGEDVANNIAAEIESRAAAHLSKGRQK